MSGDEVEGIAAEQASMKAEGYPLASGFVVPPGSSLLGAVVPSAGLHRPAADEWMAMLTVTGDPRQVMTDLEQQATRLGMPFLTRDGMAPFTCAGYDGEDFDGYKGPPIEGYRCAAQAANESRTASMSIELDRLHAADQLAVSHLFLRYVAEGPWEGWASQLPEPNDRVPLAIPQPWPALPEAGEIVSPLLPFDVVRVQEGSELVGPPRLGLGPSPAVAMFRINGDRDTVVEAYQRQLAEIEGSEPADDTSVSVPGGELRTWHHPGAGGHYVDAYVFGTDPSWLYISVTYD